MKIDAQNNQLPALFLIGAIVANHSIFRLGALSAIWIVALLVIVAAVTLLAPRLEAPGPDRAAPTPYNMAIGLAILLPAVASLLLGWNREFAFSGDQLFHVKQIYYMTFWWAQPPATPSIGILGHTLGFEDFQKVLSHPLGLLRSRAALLLVLLLGTWLCYRKAPIWAAVFAAIAFIGWGALEQSIYQRYPGAGYFLGQIFAVPAFLTSDAELSGRITNVAAIVVWLFLLRPLFLKRWPDLAILPAALFAFWQKDLLYYIDSTYLEAWAFIFTFLAIELVIARGRSGAPLACLLIGSAACFKEPFIIALPLVWLAGIFPWSSLAQSLRVSMFAFIGGFPFLFYYVCRKSVPLDEIVVDRTYDLTVNAEAVLAWTNQFIMRMETTFYGLGIVAVLLALAAIPLMAWRQRNRRVQILCLTAASLELVLFFMFDPVSQYWAGYFRFFIPAFAFLACGLVALGYSFSNRVVLIVSFIMVIAQAHSAYVAVARSAGPGSERNFVEHYEAPLVFPMRSLLNQAYQAGHLSKGAPVIANQPDYTVRPVPGINVGFGPLDEMYCSCSDAHPNVMALFVRYTNLNAKFSARPPQITEYGPPPDRDAIWRKNRQEGPACIAQMRQSCAHVITRGEGDEITGALGTR